MPELRSAGGRSSDDSLLIPGEAERLLRAGDLAADQPRIEPVTGEQLAMGAGFDETAAIENGESVGVAHGRQAMGDDDGRAVAHQRVERTAHLGLADGVEVRG